MYKRQAQENVLCAFDPQSKYSILGGLLPTPKRRAEEKRGRELCEKYLEIVGMADYLEAVSYTHLDVYKRQLLGRAAAHGGARIGGQRVVHIVAAGHAQLDVGAFHALHLHIKTEEGGAVLLSLIHIW